MLFTWCSISICLRIKCHFVSISHKQTRDNKTISSLLISAMAPNILPTTPIHTCSHRRCKVRHLNGIMVSWLPFWSRFLPNSDGEKRANIPKWHDLEPTSYGHGCAPRALYTWKRTPGGSGKNSTPSRLSPSLPFARAARTFLLHPLSLPVVFARLGPAFTRMSVPLAASPLARHPELRRSRSSSAWCSSSTPPPSPSPNGARGGGREDEERGDSGLAGGAAASSSCNVSCVALNTKLRQ